MVAFSAQARARPAVVVSGVLNINEATVNQLDELPGISQRLAQAIVEQRKKRRFTRMDDLLRVRGIGRKRLHNLKGLLVFSGPSTFRVVERRGE
jgi:competence protein ComEA